MPKATHRKPDDATREIQRAGAAGASGQLADLAARGSTRPATTPATVLAGVSRGRSDRSSDDLLADVRGSR